MIKVACIGDSITQGFTLLRPAKDSYPSVLQRMLGDEYEVRNFGVLDAAARFDSDRLLHGFRRSIRNCDKTRIRL